MLHKNFFAQKAISLIAAAAILLAGCSAAEEIPGADTDDTTATVDTSEKPQTESVTVTAEVTEGQSEDATEDTSKETDGSEPASSPDETSSASSTTSASSAATTTKPASTTTTKPAAATTTPKPETTTPKPEPTTTTTKPATTTTTTPATTTPPATTTSTTAPAPETGKTLYPDPADVYKILISFKEKYPEGTPWTNETRSYTSSTIYPGYAYTGYGCAAFAFELSDAAFGSQPRTEHMNVSDIKVGDILRLDNNSHSVIVLEVQSGGVVIAEGNYNSSVHWGRFLSTSEIKSSLTYIWTRYK